MTNNFDGLNKTDFIYFYVVNECFCDWGLFCEKLNDNDIKSFRKAKTKQDVINVIHKII